MTNINKISNGWKHSHNVAHERYLSGKKPLPLSPRDTWRFEAEFEAAVAQRGEQAKTLFEPGQQLPQAA